MRSDEDLLAATRRDPRAFGEFYARHERAVFRYFYRRTHNVELAADLSAECFAAALLVSERFRPGVAPAVAWLFGIARNILGRSAERDYDDIARELRTSEAVVRKRVSRGLGALRRHGALDGVYRPARGRPGGGAGARPADHHDVAIVQDRAL
jgi:DNA-directed RNA polymerase specialized sigma24 family protein